MPLRAKSGLMLQKEAQEALFEWKIGELYTSNSNILEAQKTRTGKLKGACFNVIVDTVHNCSVAKWLMRSSVGLGS